MKKEDILKAAVNNTDYIEIFVECDFNYTLSRSVESIKITTDEFTYDIVDCLKSLNEIVFPINNDHKHYKFLSKFRHTTKTSLKKLYFESINFYDSTDDRLYKIDINKFEDKNNKVVVFNDEDLKKCKYYDELNTLIKNKYPNDFSSVINYLINLVFDKGDVLKETSLLGNKVIYKVIINNQFELLSVFNANDNSWEGLTIKKINTKD